MKDIIYIRTSTDEQNPENQLKEIFTLGNSMDEAVILEDKVSAWKDTNRPNFTKLIESVNRNSVKNIFVWDLDRLYRNRLKLVEFFQLCKFKGVKVSSYRQSWLSDLNKLPAPWNDIMFNLMLQIMGWLAEEESSKKSDRIKASVRSVKGETVSYKGNKWGRKSISQQAISKILDLHNKGDSLRTIQKEVWIYDEYGNKKKNVSLGKIQKVVKELGGK